MTRLALCAGILLALFLIGCGGADAPAEEAAPSAQTEDGLTADELENGIGPIREVTLGPLDAALAAQGEQSFTSKCTACHKMDERYVGPALGGILDRRTPEFIMNMMLNPDEMVKRHPEARALLAEYMTPMPNQNLDEAEARAILEYLRQMHETPSSAQ
ncbi:MAG: cytochrome c [Rhodothermales bacterium]|nr:cytochrome c [Rhodothermales bacterium]